MSDPMDAVPLSRLSRRQLLERIARGQDRMETLMSQAKEYLDKALAALDEQWKSMAERVGALANEVRDAQGDEGAMTAAADKLTALAAQAGDLALPSEVADPNNPAEAGPLQPEPPAGSPPAGDGAGAEPADPVDQDASVDPETGAPTEATNLPAADNGPMPGEAPGAGAAPEGGGDLPPGVY